MKKSMHKKATISVWVTKYALTRGIYQAEAEPPDMANRV